MDQSHNRGKMRREYRPIGASLLTTRHLSEEDECTWDRYIDRPQLAQHDLLGIFMVKASRTGSHQRKSYGLEALLVGDLQGMRREVMFMINNAIFYGSW